MSASTPPLSRSADGSPSSSPARIVRSLVVEAFADSTGFVTALYCRVDSTTLTSSTAAPVLLLDLLPGSTFIRGEAYSFAQLASSDAATRAAQLLEIDLPRSTNAPKSTSLRRTVSGTAGTIARVEQQGEQVVLWPSNGTSVAERKGSETNSLADQADRVGQETQEAVVVVHLRTDLGQLRPPTFANTVTVPVPSCLRNKLHLTLPSSSTVSATSSCPVWDLKVHPSLSNVESAPTSTEPLSTLVKGSFPSTHEVSIRWAAQLPPEAPAPTLVIPRSILDVNWQLDDLGSGRCGIQAKGTIEYPGLHDKHWIEINVGGQIGKDISEKMDEARSFVKIADVEGLGVLGWELKRSIEHDQPNHLREAERDAQTLSSFDHGDSPIQRTPTPRRRYSSSTVSSNRSAATRSHASWKANSLFNTAPPILHDDLDTSLLGDSKATGESLLRQSAPFDDAEPSELDLSFEDHDEQGRAESIAVSNREDGDELAAAVAPETDTSMNPRGRSRLVLRIQVSLAPLLHPKRSGTLPEFSFRATLDFPSSALVTTDHSSSPSKMRLSLPAFSIIDSREESSNISATADSGSGRTSKVSLSTSAPQLREQALAQTAVQSSEDGTARWSTTKSWKDELPQSVDVDVELPFIRTPASTEIAPPPAAVEGAPETRRKRQDSSEPRSPPKRTLSVSAASSTPRETLSLVQIQVTPISPTLSLASPSPSDWRIFYRLVFPSSSVVEFAIPLPPDSRVKVHDAWGTDGRTVEWRDEIVQNGDSEKALRITGQRDIREVLYEERKAGEYIEGAALFPFLRARVGKYKVSVLEAQGYDLNIVVHDFDLSNRSKEAKSEFTKFLVGPGSRPFLPLRFKPISTLSPNRKLPEPRISSIRPRKGKRLLPRFSSVVPFLLCLAIVLHAGFTSPRAAKDHVDARSYSVEFDSFSTLTVTATVVSTTTHHATHTLTQYVAATTTASTVSAHPTITETETIMTISPTPRTPPPPTVQPQMGISTETINSVLVWLERFKLAIRFQLEELVTNCRAFVAQLH